jgi:NAD(P)-dependent dehydrogenase (short-subunit alcohol dehydrogenase family)
MNIENKVVLITGANRGVGRAMVQEALSGGAIGCMGQRANPLPIPMGASCP